MQDLLTPESNSRRTVTANLIRLFEQYGYGFVTTSPVEYASTLERVLSPEEAKSMLRFIDPETSEVTVLRPDITPQIARVIATRLAHFPPPWRLCYEGRVIRSRSSGHARRQREVMQVGVECVGLSSLDADVEILELASRACVGSGLTGLRVELGHAGLGHRLLQSWDEPLRTQLAKALARKDKTTLQGLLQTSSAKREQKTSLLNLLDCYGGSEVLTHARALFKQPDAQQSLDELEQVVSKFRKSGVSIALGIDLADLRKFDYYSGVSFSILAAGPGRPLAEGGRYDHVVERFGLQASATGFAIDLHSLMWALDAQGKAQRPRTFPRWVVGAQSAEDAQPLLRALRQRGTDAAWVPQTRLPQLIAYAQHWDYDIAITKSGRRIHIAKVGKADAETTSQTLPWNDKSVEQILNMDAT